jgi:hypothetical protein
MTVGSRENRNPAISGFPRRTWQNVDSIVVDSLILVFLERMDLAEVSSSAEVASAWRRESFLLMPVGTFKARGNVSLPKLYLRCVWENFGTFHADTVRMVHVHVCVAGEGTACVSLLYVLSLRWHVKSLFSHNNVSFLYGKYRELLSV